MYCRVRPILENEHRRAGPGQDVDVTSFPVEGEIIVKQVGDSRTHTHPTPPPRARSRPNAFSAHAVHSSRESGSPFEVVVWVLTTVLAFVVPCASCFEKKQDETGMIAKRFEFDNVFTPASTQEEVFAEVCVSAEV